ncbi:hypothetical protein [Streptosporangium sp. NPDC087985]|uniref:hypothetical protein n=1 Tax=Streptosporangium sp. NPDC087985 TaxID=3366196 RepID=UPI00382F9723
MSIAGVHHPAALIAHGFAVLAANRLTHLDAVLGQLRQDLAELLLVGVAGAPQDDGAGLAAVGVTALIVGLVGDLQRDQALARRESGGQPVGKPTA